MERYTRFFTNGQAYIGTRKLGTSHSGGEIVGEPITRLALYESSGYEPAEILMMLEELGDYRRTGFTPDQLSRILKGVPARKAKSSSGRIPLAQHV